MLVSCSRKQPPRAAWLCQISYRKEKGSEKGTLEMLDSEDRRNLEQTSPRARMLTFRFALSGAPRSISPRPMAALTTDLLVSFHAFFAHAEAAWLHRHLS